MAQSEREARDGARRCARFESWLRRWRRIRCGMGLHEWLFVRGTHNRYFSCEHCCARRCIVGAGGYQPVDFDWLYARRPDLRPAGGLLLSRDVITVEGAESLNA